MFRNRAVLSFVALAVLCTSLGAATQASASSAVSTDGLGSLIIRDDSTRANNIVVKTGCKFFSNSSNAPGWLRGYPNGLAPQICISDGTTSVNSFAAGGDCVDQNTDQVNYAETGELADVACSAAAVNRVIVFSGTGDDTIRVATGSLAPEPLVEDKFEAHLGIGTDTFNGSSRSDYVYGDSNADTINGKGGNDHLYGEDDIDTIRGGDGDDQIDGGNGDDKLSGEANGDTIHGNPGNDDIYGGSGGDTLHGDENSDAIAGEADNDTIWGGDGDDNRAMRDDAAIIGLNGGASDDRIFGYAEGRNTCDSDKLYGGGETDHMEGGCGDDRLYGEFGDDYLWSNTEASRNTPEAADLVDGGPGSDNLYGSDGLDNMVGDLTNDDLNAGDDEIHGYGGRDYLYGGPRNDYLYGGDELTATGGQAGGDQVLDGERGNDNVYGEQGNDYLNGSEGEDWLEGSNGADTITGGADPDHIWGGPDDDKLKDSDRSKPNDTPSSIDDFHGEGGNDFISTWDVKCNSLDKYPPSGMPPDVEGMGNVSAMEMKGSCKGGSTDVVSCGSGDDSGWTADWMDDVPVSGADGCEMPLHAYAYFSNGDLVVRAGLAGTQDDYGPGYRNARNFPGQENELTVGTTSDGRNTVREQERYYIYTRPNSGCTYKGNARYYITCNPSSLVLTYLEWGDDETDTSSSFGKRVPRAIVTNGGPGNDDLEGGPGADTITGGDGDDKIDGKGQDDYLFGDNFGVFGGGEGTHGNDEIIPGEGFDTVFGGGGADWLKMSKNEYLPQGDTFIDCGEDPESTDFDTGSKPVNEDWADLDIFDAARADNCENIAEPEPPPYQAPTLDDADI